MAQRRGRSSPLRLSVLGPGPSPGATQDGTNREHGTRFGSLGGRGSRGAGRRPPATLPTLTRIIGSQLRQMSR